MNDNISIASDERMSVLNEGEDDSIELQSPQEESRRNCAGIATIEFVGTTNCWIQLRSVRMYIVV